MWPFSCCDSYLTYSLTAYSLNNLSHYGCFSLTPAELNVAMVL